MQYRQAALSVPTAPCCREIAGQRPQPSEEIRVITEAELTELREKIVQSVRQRDLNPKFEKKDFLDGIHSPPHRDLQVRGYYFTTKSKPYAAVKFASSRPQCLPSLFNYISAALRGFSAVSELRAYFIKFSSRF